MTDVLPFPGEAAPYGPKLSGWSGSATSEASEPDRRRRQAQVYRLLARAGWYGMTWRELADAAAMHHGSASGALSAMHKAGMIARLAETRLRCKVYVHPSYVNGRPTETHGRIDPARADLYQQAYRAGYLRALRDVERGPTVVEPAWTYPPNPHPAGPTDDVGAG